MARLNQNELLTVAKPFVARVRAMDKQELFDQAVDNLHHLMRQGSRSVSGEGCDYRNPEGLKCAVGGIMTDEEYDPGMEGWSYATMADLTQFMGPEDTPNDRLLIRLQTMHDSHDLPMRAWPDELEEIAATHGVTYTIPDDIKELRHE